MAKENKAYRVRVKPELEKLIERMAFEEGLPPTTWIRKVVHVHCNEQVYRVIEEIDNARIEVAL